MLYDKNCYTIKVMTQYNTFAEQRKYPSIIYFYSMPRLRCLVAGLRATLDADTAL